MKIAEHVIQTIKSKLPPAKVADILGLEVRKKAIICPYHADTNPSMSCGHPYVFNCFACGTKKDVISFYAEQRSLSFPEAIAELASHSGIEIDRARESNKKAHNLDKKFRTWSTLEEVRQHFSSFRDYWLDCEHDWFNDDTSFNKKIFRLRSKKPGGRKLPLPVYCLSDGRWVSHKPDNHPMPAPYRWLEFKDAQVILLLEGESDVDAAVKYGFAAVTTGCADSWKECYTEFFCGRSVVIIPDNDAAGRRFLKATLSALKSVCQSVKIVHLSGPAKFDVRDFFNAGGTREMLQALIDAAPDTIVEWDPPKASWQSFERLPRFDPEEMLPESLRFYLEHLAADLQCPIDALAASAIAGLSAVLGAKLGLRPKQAGAWIEWPNLWFLLIAPPGDKKTIIAKESLRPLFVIDDELLEENLRTRATRLTDLYVEQASKKYIEAQISEVLKKGGDLEFLRRRLSEINARILETEQKGDRCLVLHDVTPEKAKALLIANPNGLLQFNDEFGGWWRNLQQGAHSDARSVYLESWGGGTIKVQRVKGTLSGWSILSFVSTTQPDLLKGIIQQIKAGSDENDGLLQRFGLIINHDRPIGTFHWHDRAPNPAAREIYELLFRRLWELKTEDFTGDPERRFIHFSSAAQSYFAQWLVAHENWCRESRHNPALVSHLAKQSRLFCSLALIFHMVILFDAEHLENPRLLCDEHREVSLHAAQLAAAWCEYTAAHIRKTYDPKAGYWDPSVRSFAAAVQLGKIRDGISRKEILGLRMQHLKTAKELDRALDQLKRLNLVQDKADYEPGKQRPRTIIRLNPMPYGQREMTGNFEEETSHVHCN